MPRGVYPRTEYHRRINSEGHKGQPCWCKGLTKENSEIIRKMSEKIRGSKHGFYGKHHTEEAKENMRKKLSQRIGHLNPNWKGGKENHKLTMKKYRQTIKYKLYRRKVSQERRMAGSTLIDLDAWKGKIKNLGYRCQICGAVLSLEKITIDHIIPVSKGGGNQIDNLQPLCFKCNRKKSNKILAN